MLQHTNERVLIMSSSQSRKPNIVVEPKFVEPSLIGAEQKEEIEDCVSAMSQNLSGVFTSIQELPEMNDNDVCLSEQVYTARW
jgi:hypothetical protein